MFQAVSLLALYTEILEKTRSNSHFFHAFEWAVLVLSYVHGTVKSISPNKWLKITQRRDCTDTFKRSMTYVKDAQGNND